MRLRDLKPDGTYRVWSLEQAARIGPFGGLLKHVSHVKIDPNGQLLRLADRHFSLPMGTEELHLSGSALMSGILLRPMFRGTGYDKNQRTQGDFGSDIYVVEEME